MGETSPITRRASRACLLMMVIVAPVAIAPAAAAAHESPELPLRFGAERAATGWDHVWLGLPVPGETQIRFQASGLDLAPEDGISFAATLLQPDGTLYAKFSLLVHPADGDRRWWGSSMGMGPNGPSSASVGMRGGVSDLNVTFGFYHTRPPPQELSLAISSVVPATGLAWQITSSVDATVRNHTTGDTAFLLFARDFEATEEPTRVADTTVRTKHTYEAVIEARHALYAQMDEAMSDGRLCVVALPLDAAACPPVWPAANPDSWDSGAEHHAASPGTYTFRSHGERWEPRCVEAIACIAGDSSRWPGLALWGADVERLG